jgi:hypothetical protein
METGYWISAKEITTWDKTKVEMVAKLNGAWNSEGDEKRWFNSQLIIYIENFDVEHGDVKARESFLRRQREN